MPNENNNPFLPFPTRDMLAFGKEDSLDIEILVVTDNTSDIFISGITKNAPFRYKIRTAGSLTLESFIQAMDDIPIFLTTEVTGASWTATNLWAEIYLRVNQNRVLKLCSGYVSRARGLSWPGPSGNTPWQEQGLPVNWGFNNPAAGANFTNTFQERQALRLHNLGFRLVTSAAVADRTVRLQMADGGGALLFDVTSNTNQAASLTYDYVFSAIPQVNTESSNNIVHLQIPPNIWVAGLETIKTAIVNIQAADQISNITLNGAILNFQF